MSTLFISLASSGLPSDKGHKDIWCPRICAALCNDAGETTDHYAVNIRAEGRKIDAEATKVHGITAAAADRTGVYELFALGTILGLKANGKRGHDYHGLASCARRIVVWNAEFVRRVLTDLYKHHGEPGSAWLRPGLEFISLQDLATPWARLPAGDGSETGQYRKPTREEAVEALIGSIRRGLHTPDDNLNVERLIFDALKVKGAIERDAA